MATSRFELLQMDEDGSERIDEYATLEEGLTDLIERVRLTETLGEDAGPMMIGCACLAGIPDGLAYVNVICGSSGERLYREDRYQLVSGRAERVEAEYFTLEVGLEEVLRRLNESIAARKPTEFSLVRGRTYICAAETFQAGLE